MTSSSVGWLRTMSRKVYDKGPYVIRDTSDYELLKDNLELARNTLVNMGRLVSAGVVMSSTNQDLNRDAIQELLDEYMRHDDIMAEAMSEIAAVLGESVIRG
jgi:hypothetical protein